MVCFNILCQNWNKFEDWGYFLSGWFIADMLMWVLVTFFRPLSKQQRLTSNCFNFFFNLGYELFQVVLKNIFFTAQLTINHLSYQTFNYFIKFSDFRASSCWRSALAPLVTTKYYLSFIMSIVMEINPSWGIVSVACSLKFAFECRCYFIIYWNCNCTMMEICNCILSQICVWY